MTRPRLTYANVTATLALFIALGGTSYAVTKLPKGSVGSDQLRAAAVTNSKLASGAVTADKLAPGAVSAGPRGPRGSEGPAGPTGATGATGPAGPSKVIVATLAGMDLTQTPGEDQKLVSVQLPPGSWNLDAQVKLDYNPNPATNDIKYFDCGLRTALGVNLIRSTTRIGSTVGTTPDGRGAATLPLVSVADLTSATQIALVCQHPEGTSGEISATNIVLRATLVGSISKG